MVIHGGGFATGVVFCPLVPGSLQPRTDVGGASRCDRSVERRIPPTEFVGHAAANDLGIESFAVELSRARRLCLAVGMYTARWTGVGAVMRSDDRGDFWKGFPSTVEMGGNEFSRPDGER